MSCRTVVCHAAMLVHYRSVPMGEVSGLAPAIEAATKGKPTFVCKSGNVVATSQRKTVRWLFFVNVQYCYSPIVAPMQL